MTKRGESPKRRPATTPEGRENQLIALAYDVAEKQLVSNTASSQVVTHFLKAGSSRDRLEQERIKNENLLLAAKIEQMASMKRIETLYENALNAMKTYTGQSSDEDDDDDDPFP